MMQFNGITIMHSALKILFVPYVEQCCMEDSLVLPEPTATNKRRITPPPPPYNPTAGWLHINNSCSIINLYRLRWVLFKQLPMKEKVVLG